MKHRTETRRCIGKAIVELDRAFMAAIEDGQPTAAVQAALDKAHALLQATDDKAIRALVDAKTLPQYFGRLFLESHPAVRAYVLAADAALHAEGVTEQRE